MITSTASGLSASGVRSEFFDQLREATESTFYQDLSTRVASTLAEEKFRWLGSFPLVREWGGGRVATGLRAESYDAAIQKYELTLAIDRDAIDDDQTGQIRLRIGEMAAYAATHKDYLIGQLLLNGATTGYVAYDGATYFSTTHESGDSGAQDNDITVTVTSATNPTTDDLKLAIKSAIQQMLGYLDDFGKSVRLTPTGLVLAVPAALYFTMLEAIQASVVTQTSNVLQGAARVLAIPELNGQPTEFYLLKTNKQPRPFVFVDRMPIEFKLDDSKVFSDEMYYAGVRARYTMIYGEWRHAVKVTIAE